MSGPKKGGGGEQLGSKEGLRSGTCRIMRHMRLKHSTTAFRAWVMVPNGRAENDIMSPTNAWAPWPWMT